jgi:flagellar biosynthesis protein FlhA
MLLAIGDDLTSLPGTVTKEPVFGLDAKWVPVEMRRHIGLSGATLVDRSSVVTTHLAEIVRSHAHQLLGREDVKALIDMTKTTHPVVVDELTPTPLSLGEVQRCLQSLLAERVCIRDLVRIFEAMSARARSSTDPDGLLEAARGALGPAISATHAHEGRLPVITFDPLLEQTLLESLRTGEAGAFLMLDPAYAERLALEAARLAHEAEQTGDHPVLVCAQPLRLPLYRLVQAAAPSLPVLSYSELGAQLSINPVGAVDVAHASAA